MVVIQILAWFMAVVTTSLRLSLGCLIGMFLLPWYIAWFVYCEYRIHCEMFGLPVYGEEPSFDEFWSGQAPPDGPPKE